MENFEKLIIENIDKYKWKNPDEIVSFLAKNNVSTSKEAVEEVINKHKIILYPSDPFYSVDRFAKHCIYFNSKLISPFIQNSASRIPASRVTVTNSMPLRGKIAGGYIGVFIAFPAVCKIAGTVVSPNTEMLEKGSALTDLGVMTGCMLFFKQFAAKNPKTAAFFMIGIAGEHMYDSIQPLLRELEKGQTGMTLYYKDKKTHLESGVSCMDGRKPVFLQPTSNLPSFSEWKHTK